MENTGKTDLPDIKIQGLLDRLLKVRSAELGRFTSHAHPDEDTLSSFVEGNIKEREATPVIAHLIECSFCRHITTELIRLDLAFAEMPEYESIAENRPTRISDVLDGILNKIFGSNEGAVFAHHEDERKEENPGEDKE